MVMISQELASQLIEIDEEEVKQAADLLNGDNNFKKVLFLGDIYRRAGLEPIYLATPDMNSLAVSCRETFGKLLH